MVPAGASAGAPRRSWLLAGIAAALMGCSAAAAEPLDAALRAAISELQTGGTIDRAIGHVSRATVETPRLGAAHLLAGDLFSLLGGVAPLSPEQGAGAARDVSTRSARLLPSADPATLRTELQARAAHVGRPADSLPLNVLGIDRRIDHVLLVDIAGPRLFVLARRGNGLQVVGDFYASVGLMGGGKAEEGDMRTPLGVYRITGELPPSRIKAYHGAFAWTLDYPNADDRAAGRTGSDIWIHGVPRETIARPPYSTEGCIALANEDLQTLRRMVRFSRTAVVIVDRVTWATRDAWLSARERVLNRPEGQRSAEARAGRIAATRVGLLTPEMIEPPRDGRLDQAAAGREPQPPVVAGAASRDRGIAGMGQDRGGTVIVSADASLRQWPRGPIVANVPRGTPLTVLGSETGGWLRVRHQSQEAVVFQGLVAGD